jgi:hypothetical protein
MFVNAMCLHDAPTIGSGARKGWLHFRFGATRISV